MRTLVTAALVHIARWLAFQLGGDGERPIERPANITIFSAPEPR